MHPDSEPVEPLPRKIERVVANNGRLLTSQCNLFLNRLSAIDLYLTWPLVQHSLSLT